MDLGAQNKALLDAIYKRFDENECKIMQEINGLKQVNEQLVGRCVKLEKESEMQRETILLLEKRINANNVIIHGIDEKESEMHLEEEVVQLLNCKLDINIKGDDIEYVGRIGKVVKDKNRPIKLQFAHQKIKTTIMREKRRLAGSEIFINDDLPRVLRIRDAERRKKNKESRTQNGIKRLATQSSNEGEVGEGMIQQEIKRINRRPTDRNGQHSSVKEPENKKN